MASHAEHDPDMYYVPHEGSLWPAVAILGMLLFTGGFSMMLNESEIGKWFTLAGTGVLTVMFFGWLRDVINESMAGLYNEQMDRTFRQAMMWFIFSEVMFFAAFFGALWYARTISVPWLGGAGNNFATNLFIWTGWEAHWPTNGPAEWGGAFNTMPAWADSFKDGFLAWANGSLPLVNTLLLLTSGVTLTWAHHGIFHNNNKQVVLGLFLTVVLGVVFLCCQALEYAHAYDPAMNLTLESGIYGSTFFMLTGFHGFHVTLGTIMLIVVLFRAMKGHWTSESHFGFEGVAWYWHFVDIVWLGLFIFVYIL